MSLLIFRIPGASRIRAGIDVKKDSARTCLVLLDMRMPVLTGIEFRREQLRDPSIAEVPVVAFAADARDRGEAALLGITSFISKPVDVERLLDVVSQFCGDDRGRHHASLPAGATTG